MFLKGCLGRDGEHKLCVFFFVFSILVISPKNIKKNAIFLHFYMLFLWTFFDSF